jgi:cellulose biosynthesis protein BcsQ
VRELAPGRGQGLPPEGSAALYFAFKAPGSELACFLKEGIQSRYRPHLLIDLDPQTNATVTLISEDQWAEMDESGRTIAQLFEDRLNPQNTPKFDIERAIVRRVSTINDGIARLDLLPSSIQLIDLQDRIPMIALSGNFTANPLEILRVALQPVIDRYDYIIVDCPPSLGTVTKNGLRISTGYVIPTIPDIVSTWGIYQIVDNVERFFPGRRRQRGLPSKGSKRRVRSHLASPTKLNPTYGEIDYLGRGLSIGQPETSSLPSPLPSPLVVFAVGRGAGLPEKDATIRQCNMPPAHST